MTHENILFLVPPDCAFPLPTARVEAAGNTVSVVTVPASGTLPALPWDTYCAVFDWLGPKNPGKEAVLKQVVPQLAGETIIFSSAYEIGITEIAAWCQSHKHVYGFSPFLAFRESCAITLSLPLQAKNDPRKPVHDFLSRLGLEACWIQDTPGMVLPRIYAMLANEAAFAVQEGIATPEDIDTAMRLGTNYPWGPLTWADMVGLDTVLDILDRLWQVYREARYRPCPLLQKLVAVGFLGKKSGQGFYAYTGVAVEQMSADTVITGQSAR